jgi:exonuclease VII large subunit
MPWSNRLETDQQDNHAEQLTTLRQQLKASTLMHKQQEQELNTLEKNIHALINRAVESKQRPISFKKQHLTS